MLEGKLIIIPALGHQNKGKSSFTGSGLLVLMSQCGNNNELALQHGGFCTTWSLVAKGLLLVNNLIPWVAFTKLFLGINKYWRRSRIETVSWYSLDNSNITETSFGFLHNQAINDAVRKILVLNSRFKCEYFIAGRKLLQIERKAAKLPEELLC